MRAHRPRIGRPRPRGAAIGIGLLAVLLASIGLGASVAAGSGSLRSAPLISASRCARNTAAGAINYISPFGYDSSASIIDVFMAQKLGYFKDLCLKVAVDTGATDAETLVSSGRAQATSIGSAADAILTKASGANLTAVATYGDTDPHAILTNAKITRLSQLDGGTLGYFINLTPASVAMLVKAGATVSRIHLISLTNYDPTIVTRGQLDGLVGYASNQGLALKADGVKFHEFLPAQFGIKGTYNVMQFNTDFLHAHRAAVADFMRADLKALDYCLVNKTACVDYMAGLAAKNNEGAAFPRVQQLRVWDYESRYVEGDTVGGHGVQTAAEWMSEWQEVKKYGALCGLTASDVVPALSAIMDPSLVAGLYHGTTLIWPGS